jgi:hypothetical protein
MAKQKFDFKKFMLHQGEKVGLYLSLGMMTIMLGIGGYMMFSSQAPAATAKVVKDQSTQLNGKFKSFNPDPKDGELPVEWLQGVAYTFLPRSKFRTFWDFFEASRLEDSKRQRVDVLVPDQFDTSVVLAVVRTYIMNVQDDKITFKFLEGATAGAPKQQVPGTKQIGNRINSLQSAPPMAPAGMGNPLGGPGAGPGGVPPAMAQVFQRPRLRRPNPKVQLLDMSARPELKSRTARLEDKKASERFAESLQPYRMIIVSAAFPYKRQIENFQYALRFPSLSSMFSDTTAPVQFRGFNVERALVRTVEGPVKDPKFLRLNLDKDYRQVLLNAVDIEKEDEDMKNVLVHGLAMPRPLLARDQKYPKPDLPGIKKTLGELVEKSNVKSAVAEQNRRIKERFAIFPVEDEADTANTQGMREPTNPGAGAAGQQQPEPWVPEYVLMRFVDVDVKPGNTYQYRLQVKMLNPNFNKPDLVAYASLAQERELSGEWSKPVQVNVPTEQFFYAVDQAAVKAGKGVEETVTNPPMNGDKVAVQVHRWIDDERLNPDQPDTYPIGDWTIAERIEVNRGEYIGRLAHVELPVWHDEWEAFILPRSDAKKAGPRPRTVEVPGIRINFNTGALLVDFEGGLGNYRIIGASKPRSVRDDAPVEMLILMPDGRLEVRNSMDDASDKERIDRHTNWQKWLEEVKRKVDEIRGVSRPDAPLFKK